jgi:long-subunit acyl-CoA synthetase (AMP-forming)
MTVFQNEINDLIDRYDNKREFVYYTSGSTGKPKKIVLSFDTMKMVVEENIRMQKITSNSVIANLCIPPSSIAFSCFLVLAAHVSGAKIITKKFNSKTYIDDLQGGTHTFIIPAVYRTMSRTKKWKKLDLSSYDVVMTGSDIPPEGIKQNVLSKGAKRFLQIYGSTEVPPAISESEDEKNFGVNISPLIDYKVANDGELFIKWKTQNEYWASGDLVEKIEDGFKMIGRKKNILRLNCAHVQPELIEQFIMNEAGVSRALVTRSKNDKIGVYYEGHESQTDSVQSVLNKWYNNDENIIDFVKWVPKIETNHLNKVIRHQSL